RLRFARSRLDHVGIDRPLHKKALAIAAFGDEAFLPRRALEGSDELLADDRALPLGVIDAGELREEHVGGAHRVKADAWTERGDHLLGLVLAQLRRVDEETGESVADRARDERR